MPVCQAILSVLSCIVIKVRQLVTIMLIQQNSSVFNSFRAIPWHGMEWHDYLC